MIKKLPRLGRGIVFFALAVFMILSTPFAGSRLMVSLQTDAALTEYNQGAQAIVILGGGVYSHAAEYGGLSTLSGSPMERVKYGAYLFDKTGLPILVSGGDPLNTGVREGDVMKSVMEEALMTPVTWVENRSRDTYENAAFSYDILAKEGKTKIYLVTHGWHMPRAKDIFERFGFKVIPAPTIIYQNAGFTFYNILPQSGGLELSSLALREWIGRLWYTLL
ncbi:MAG: YdcF family protein [Deltaproteobacteria bacterium]|nr:YdcF family protein [Deltaproteobacteria bacterium]